MALRQAGQALINSLEQPTYVFTGKTSILEFPDDTVEGLRPEPGTRQIHVKRAERLQPGNVIEAPAIIQAPTTTLLVLPGSRVTLTRYGNYGIEIAAEQ